VQVNSRCVVGGLFEILGGSSKQVLSGDGSGDKVRTDITELSDMVVAGYGSLLATRYMSQLLHMSGHKTYVITDSYILWPVLLTELLSD